MKKFLTYLLGAALLVGSASCSDDLEYTPGELPDNAQVYFPSTNATSIDLDGTKSSFEVTITRNVTDEAITVPVSLTGGNGLYTAPASVAFAAGEKTASIAIGYKAEEIGPDNYMDLTIAIADEAFVTPYGMSRYTIRVGIPETWSVKHTGDYLYSQYLQGPDPGLELLQSDIYPNRWKITNWGYGVDFCFTWDQTTDKIVVDDQLLGYTHSTYGPVQVDDLAHYIGSSAMGESYYEDGVFYFNVVYYVSAGEFGYGYETFTLNK